MKFINLIVSMLLYWGMISFILMNSNVHEWHWGWRITLIILSLVATHRIFYNTNKHE